MNERGAKAQIAFSVVPESAYVLTHLRRSLEQRRPNQNEASEFLSVLHEQLSHPNPYILPQEQPSGPSHLGSGFHFSAYQFESTSGVWVAKIGHPYAPFRGYPPPDAKEHADLYNEQVAVLSGCFQDALPHLIPYPQHALHVEGKNRDTTIILQPYISGLLPVKGALHLPHEQRQQILDELEAFTTISQDMREGFGLIPDLVHRSNLFIAPKMDQYHLVLVDNQCSDRNAQDASAVNMVISLAFSRGIADARRSLKSGN